MMASAAPVAASSHASARWHRVHETLPDVARKVGKDALAAVAVALDGADVEKLTYGELLHRSEVLAAQLSPHVTKDSDCVCVLMHRGVDCLVAAVAVSMAGVVYVPLDERYPRSRAEMLTRDCGCVALITSDFAGGGSLPSQLLPDFRGPVINVSRLNYAPGTVVLHPPPCSSADSPCYIMYTSGSTGIPKGVVMSHRSLIAYLHAFSEAVSFPPVIDKPSSLLMSTPSGFDINLYEIWGALLTGSMALVPEHIEIQPRWFRGASIAMNRYCVSFVHGVPCVLEGLLQGGWQCGDVSVVSCGEVFPVPSADALRQRAARVFNGYGPTETHYCTMYRVPPPPTPLGATIPIGRAMRTATCYVEHADGSACQPGEVGELVVGGQTVAIGYLHRQAETDERFLRRPTGRVYRTGDLVRQLPSGELDYVGRRDAQLNSGGLRVEAAEVERPLREHAQVADAAVVETQGILRAYVVLKQALPSEGQPELAASLSSYLIQRLPFYHVPRRWQFLHEFPRTSTQKVDRKALTARGLPETLEVPEDFLERCRPLPVQH